MWPNMKLFSGISSRARGTEASRMYFPSDAKGTVHERFRASPRRREATVWSEQQTTGEGYASRDTWSRTGAPRPDPAHSAPPRVRSLRRPVVPVRLLEVHEAGRVVPVSGDRLVDVSD